MKINKAAFFKRQTTLAEIGEQGQDLLQKAKVLVVGCGGLGSPISIYLATSGVGHLHLVDFDTVSISNLHRQVHYKVDDVNKPKAEILANSIKNKAPFTKVTFTNRAVDKESILKLVNQFDVVVDGTDSLPIKYLINDACVLLKKPLVYGSLYKFDGYVATFNVMDNEGGLSCNLRDAFPKIATDIPNCEEAGTMNPIVGIIALLQVNEVIKLLTGIGSLLENKLLVYNALRNEQLKISLRKNEPLDIQKIFEQTDYSSEFCLMQNQELNIGASIFKEKIGAANLLIVSIINDIDAKLPFKAHQKIPYKSFDINSFVADSNKEYVVVCNKGITSYDITEKLKNKYPNMKIWSLSGGIQGFNN